MGLFDRRRLDRPSETVHDARSPVVGRPQPSRRIVQGRPGASGRHGRDQDDPWTRAQSLDGRISSELTPTERQLVGFAELRNEVNNGGFNQFFFNSGGDWALDALSAAEAVNLDVLAGLLRRALAVLGEPYPVDRLRRQDVLLKLDGEREGLLQVLDGDYYQLEVDLDLDAAMQRLAEACQ